MTTTDLPTRRGDVRRESARHSGYAAPPPGTRAARSATPGVTRTGVPVASRSDLVGRCSPSTPDTVRRRTPSVPPVPATRRELARQRDRSRRRIHRLRRTVGLVVLLLAGATAMARAAQDPSVALPRPAAVLLDAGTPSSVGAEQILPATAPGGQQASPSAAAAVIAATASSTSSSQAAPTAAQATQAAQPSPVAVPASGTGNTHPVAIPAVPLAGTGRVVRFSVEVEGGLPADEAEFARIVATVLTDQRGWQTQDHVRFVPVQPEAVAAGAAVDARVTLASPQLTARLCAPMDVTMNQVSCWQNHRAVLNLQRWLNGATPFGSDLVTYRTYLVNHEVGHGLGHGHVTCSGAGRPAGIMVQQTLGLGGCTAWPWPTAP